LISILIITVTCMFIGFLVAGGKREKIMNQEFCDNFKKDSKALLKDKNDSGRELKP